MTEGISYVFCGQELEIQYLLRINIISGYRASEYALRQSGLTRRIIEL
jgi:hypothetical protein